jgi:chitodextrinase
MNWNSFRRKPFLFISAILVALVIIVEITVLIPDVSVLSPAETIPAEYLHTPSSPEFPTFNGSFIQPYLADSFDDTKWRKEFEYMKSAGINQLFIQWTSDSKNKTTVYPSGIYGYRQNTKTDIVEAALSNAQLMGIDVYLGLQINDDWWDSKLINAAWLKKEADVSKMIFDDLSSKYGKYQSLKGWYISFEVDNWRFCTWKEWDNLILFYDTVLSHIKSATTLQPVVISPFFNPSGGLSPSEWQAMWTYILLKCPLDILSLQDGVGAGNVTNEKLSKWFCATLNAIKKARPSVKLWSTTESFTKGYKPMPLNELVEDMRAVNPFVSGFISFSYNHYTSPQQVNPVYHETYLSYRNTGIMDNLSPSTPKGLTTELIDKSTVKINWNKSTDNIGTAGYRVYKNNRLLQTLYDNTTSITLSSLTPNTKYEFKVNAFDAAGNLSEFSNTAVFELQNTLSEP